METREISEKAFKEEAVGNGLYQKLYHAIQNASLYEIKLSGYLHDTKDVKKDADLLQRIEEITTVMLPDRMGRLIGDLELHNSFLSLGRYIRSFTDAEFVVERLQEPIEMQLDKHKITNPYQIIDNLVKCCDELLLTVAQLTPQS